MTGPEHYKAAELAMDHATDAPDNAMLMAALAAAQVHATLAQAAATVYATNFIDGCLPEPHLDEAWNRVTR